MTDNNITLAIKKGKLKLKEASISNYNWEVDQFIMFILNCSKNDIIINKDKLDKEFTLEKEEIFWEYINKRASNYPFQYIIGECEFMGLKFFVGDGVLIPRSDTEILVETILEINKINKFTNGLDLCTGTGCIPISLGNYGNINMTAVEFSEIAFKYAKKNLEYYNENSLDKNIEFEFLLGDLFTPIKNNKKFDFIVSNPPYIEREVIKTLMEEVRDYEPTLALDGGESGLDFYIKITKESKNFLCEDGWLFFEIGYNQGELVLNILKENGFTQCKVLKDYSNNNRVVYGKYNN